MRQKQALFFLWAGIMTAVLITSIGCHSTRPAGKTKQQNKSAAKDSSAAKKIDDGPSEFFQ